MTHYEETIVKIVGEEVKNQISWMNMTEILFNIALFGKLELQESRAEYNDESLMDFLMKLFDSLDAQFNLIERLDKLIDFKKIFGSFFGGILEKVDQKFIRAIVRYIIFPLIISFFDKKHFSLDNVEK